jgi:hypothetical protein
MKFARYKERRCVPIFKPTAMLVVSGDLPDLEAGNKLKSA